MGGDPIQLRDEEMPFKSIKAICCKWGTRTDVLLPAYLIENIIQEIRISKMDYLLKKASLIKEKYFFLSNLHYLTKGVPRVQFQKQILF